MIAFWILNTHVQAGKSSFSKGDVVISTVTTGSHGQFKDVD